MRNSCRNFDRLTWNHKSVIFLTECKEIDPMKLRVNEEQAYSSQCKTNLSGCKLVPLISTAGQLTMFTQDENRKNLLIGRLSLLPILKICVVSIFKK